MMQADASARPREFWDTIAEHGTAKVRPMLGQDRCEREPVIAYLCDLEGLIRYEANVEKRLKLTRRAAAFRANGKASGCSLRAVAYLPISSAIHAKTGFDRTR